MYGRFQAITCQMCGLFFMDFWNRNLILAHRLASMKMTSMMGPGVPGEMTHCSGSRWMPGG